MPHRLPHKNGAALRMLDELGPKGEDSSPFSPTGDWDDTPISPEEGAWGGPVADDEEGASGLWGTAGMVADDSELGEPAWLSSGIQEAAPGPRERIKAVKVGKVMGCFARRNGFHVEVVMQHELDETLPKNETSHRLWIADEVRSYIDTA